MSYVLRNLWLICGLLLWTAPPAFAQNVFTYQGQLFGAHGVVNANYEMTFRLYADAEGGAPLWQEHFNNVPVVDDVFLVELGHQSSLQEAIERDTALYLAIQLGNHDEMTPRMLVGTALRARWAAHAQDVSGEHIHPQQISIGSRLVIDDGGNWVGPAETFIGPASHRCEGKAPVRPQHPSSHSQNLHFFSAAPEIPLKTVKLGAIKRPWTKNLINPAYAPTSKAQVSEGHGSRNVLAGERWRRRQRDWHCHSPGVLAGPRSLFGQDDLENQ